MNALSIFDGTRAIARLLRLLHDEDREGLATLNMYQLMRERYDVARTAVDSSLEAAVKLGLVERYPSGGFTVNSLTLKGVSVAVKIKELEDILTEDSSLTSLQVR